MAQTTRVSGENGSANVGGTTVYWKGEFANNCKARGFLARATGDDAGIIKIVGGLTTDSNCTISQVMLDAWNDLMDLDGTEVVCTVFQGTVTVFECTCVVEASEKGAAEDMGLGDITLKPQGVPTVGAPGGA